MTNHAGGRSGQPTDEEVAAALAAVHALLQTQGASRHGVRRGWTRAARAEAVGLVGGAGGWASAERPR